MNSAGKLQAAMDLGAYDERFDATHDQFEAQKQSYEMRSKRSISSRMSSVRFPEVQLSAGSAGS